MSHATSVDEITLATDRSDLADTIVRSSIESMGTIIDSSLYRDPVNMSSSLSTESMSQSHSSSSSYYSSPYVSGSNMNHDSTTIIRDSLSYSTIIPNTSVISAMVLSDSFSNGNELYISTNTLDTTSTVLLSSVVLTGSLFDTTFSTDISTSDNLVSASASISSMDRITLSTVAFYSSSTNIASNKTMLSTNGLHGSDEDVASENISKSANAFDR